MYVKALELVDFRSYSRVVVDLEPGPCVLVGPNGAGKTNLIEALYYVATLSSHRVALDAPLVRSGADRAVVRTVISQEQRDLLVELSIEPGKANKARLGRAPTTRARDILGALKMVMFAPEDLALVRGEPGERRRFLDDLLVARQPRFAGVRSDYERVLRQRNALLRSAYLARRVGGTRGGDLSTLEVWDEHLAQCAAALVAGRIELATAIAPHLTKAYEQVSDRDGQAKIGYTASFGDIPTGGVEELRRALLEALRGARQQETERGMTLIGPHRDEVVLTLGDLPAKGYASHGESWSFALALRLAAYDLLRTDGLEPVLVLDDVFSELDAGRRRRLAELVSGASQTLVTCAVDEDVPPSLRCATYQVGEGQVRRV